MGERENHIFHQPDNKSGDRQRELAWVEQNRDIFWLISKVATDQVGRGSIVIDTTTQVPEGGHPIGFLALTENELQGNAVDNYMQSYDPNKEFVVTLLASEDRTTTYLGTAPPIGWTMATKTPLAEQQPNKKSEIPEALFDLGQMVVTPGAIEAAQNIRRHPIQLIARHVEGEWGDLPSEDIAENDFALQRGFRIFSAYNIENAKFYVITEWDRSVTTVLLPFEY